MQVFLAEKVFEGCGELELTDEIKVTIAAHACRLLLHRQTDLFPRLITILVYPSAYWTKRVVPMGSVVPLKVEEVALGEAWKDGVAIVSWDTVLEIGQGHGRGTNLVLHEFAHLLDMEDGAADGTPTLKPRSRYDSWTRVMEEEYRRLKSQSALGHHSVLDHYGAMNASEFFAVATEAFFEKSGLLRKRHSALYDELKSFYQQDPAGLLPLVESPED